MSRRGSGGSGRGLLAPGLCGGLAVPGILVACVAVAGLWLLQVEGVLRHAMTGHAQQVLRQIQNVAEAGLGLGLELEELWRLTDLLDRLRAADPDLGALAILDEQGGAVFATSRAEVGAKLLDGLDLHAALPGGTGGLRMASGTGASGTGASGGAGGTVYTLPLSTAYGTAAGQVMLRVPDSVIQARLTAFALDLIPLAAALAGGGALVALLAAAWARRRLDRRLQPLTQALWSLRAPVGDAALQPEPVDDTFVACQRERLRLLAAATAEVTRLDETA